MSAEGGEDCRRGGKVVQEWAVKAEASVRSTLKALGFVGEFKFGFLRINPLRLVRNNPLALVEQHCYCNKCFRRVTSSDKPNIPEVTAPKLTS